MDPNTSTEDVVAAGVTALAGVALGKAGGVAVKAGMRYGKGGVRRVVNMAAKRLRGKSCVTNSFAVGTLVALSTVAGAAPIEGLEVGDRVATIAAASETQVDDTWGVVELELDVGRRVTLLRPPAWFAAHDLKVGERTTVAFSLGSDGLVTGVVRDLRAFKGPTDGQGRVVLATVEGVADELYSLTFEGIDAPLHATSEHPLYSLDRDTWVGVEELTVGERLQTAEGAVTIAALERERGPHRVLNIEVEGEHEYFVGDAEVRAHNAKCGDGTFVVTPKGTVLGPGDVDLVPTAKGTKGAFMGVHRSHEHGNLGAKSGIGAHTHVPKTHAGPNGRQSRKRVSRSTTHEDIDAADAAVRGGRLRQRVGRQDAGDL